VHARTGLRLRAMRLTIVALVAVLATLVGAPAAFARDDSVTSFDGTKIALHFFPAPQGGKAPTILEGPGWSMSGATDTSSPTDPTLGVVGLAPLLKAGYNVLTWDPRGFGASGGTAQRAARPRLTAPTPRAATSRRSSTTSRASPRPSSTGPTTRGSGWWAARTGAASSW